jgi:hypothetical protein
MKEETMSDRRVLGFVAMLSVLGCGSDTPPEPAASAARITVSPAVAGYFSIGEAEKPTLERRVVSALRQPSSALVTARLVRRDAGNPQRIRFPNSNASVTEYDAHTIRVRVVRVIRDPSGRFGPVTGEPAEVDLLVTSPSAIRQFDEAGRMYLPFPGSQSPFGEADARAVRDGVEFAAVVTNLPQGNFLTESAELIGDVLVGDEGRVPLGEVAARADLPEGRD